MTDTRARRTAAEPSADDAERAADYALEDQVGYLLRCAHQRATETFNAVMAEFGVTPTQFAALAKLDDLRRRLAEPARPAHRHGPGHHLGRGRPAHQARLRAGLARPEGCARS